MTADTIRDALRRQPFEPFDVRLVDGRSFTIHHTDWLAVPPIKGLRHMIVFTPRDDDPEADPHAHWIDLQLILELTFPTAANANGPAHGRDG